MSVTFCIADAPHELVECLCVTDPAPWEVEQGYCVCCARHPGKMEQSLWPEMNLANGNARGLLEALGIEGGYLCGAWESSDLPRVKARVERLQTDDAFRREWFPLRESYQGMHGNITVIDPGQSHEQVDRYLTILKEIIEKAISEEREVYWG
jgi:hypothetical protein